MIQLNEHIHNAAQTMALVESDLLRAHTRANGVLRPEGKNLGDLATVMVLADLLAQARALKSKLLSISVGS